MKRELLLILSVAFLLVLVSSVSAGIYFSQPDSVYNLGEMVEMSVNVSPEDAGPLKIILVCDNNSLDVYRGAPTELIQLPLTSLWMNGMTGECYFTGYYGSEIKESTKFEISKKLEVNLYTTSFSAKPGGAIKISGNVKRLNGEGINGDVEITIPSFPGEAISGRVTEGEFSLDYNIKRETPAGDYRIDIIAYETTGTEKTSEGIAIADVQVLQALSNIDIALDSQSIEPGKSISFKPILNDQSGAQIIGDVAVEIKDENQNRLFQKIVKSGETIEYKSPTNMSAGYYEIKASADSSSKIKKFYVTEKALALFEISYGKLIVKNIGNIPYNKNIEIDINGKTFIQKIDGLLPGETKEYKLTGEQEVNSVKVSDGESRLSQDNVILPVAKKPNVVTGAFIGIPQLVNTPIIWIVILLILAAVILFLFRNIFKKKSVAYPAPIKSRTSVNIDSSPPKIIKLDNRGREIGGESIGRIRPAPIVKKEMEDKGIGEKGLSPIKPADKPYNYASKPYSKAINQPEEKPQQPPIEKLNPSVKIIGQIKPDSPNQAEQVLVTDGQKNRAAIIALKIKNQINKFSKENLEKSIVHVYDKKGAVYESGNFVFVVFSPLITKSFRNEIEAAKDAEKIAEGLKEHNKKFNDKIDFGIAVNSGEIINKIEDRKLKFTSLGTLTISAKKLADLSKGEVLMTREAYEKAMSEVKAEKKNIGGMEVYEVKKVADYEKNRKFINDFLKREGDNRNRNMIPKHSVSPKPEPYWIKDEEKNDSSAGISE